jgi:hypothetical protein
MDPAIRFARRVGFDKNELRRRVDVVDALVTVFAVAVSSAIVIGGVLFGLMLARYESGVAAEQQATRTATTAVLLQDPGSSGDRTSGLALAKWTAPDGTSRTGPVQAPGDQHAGASLQIWTDRSGGVVSQPIGLADVVLMVLVTVAGAMAVSYLLLRGLVYLLRRLIELWTQRAWARDWARTAPRWTGAR